MADEGRTKSPSGGGDAIVSESDTVRNKPATSAMQQPAQQQHEFTLRKLFGGAMECLLPAAYVDVSDLRQVPDHQEAFVSRSDGVSIVIEVLSFESDIPSTPPLAPPSADGDADGAEKGIGGESARHFFDDLAEANGATNSTCDFCADVTHSVMPKLSKFSKAALVGRQSVAKFRGDGTPEAVRVYLVNVRLPNVDTDLLLTVNVPYPDEASAAASPGTADTFIFPSDKNSTTRTQRKNASVNMVTRETHSETLECPPRQQNPDSTEESVAVEGITASPDCDHEEKEFVSRSEGDGEGRGGGGDDEGGNDEGGNVAVRGAAGVAALKMLVESFDILDWSLFG